MWSKLFKISGAVLGVGALFVLLVAAVSTSNNARLKQLTVNIDFAGENFFIDKKEIEETVFDLGYAIDSTRLLDINPGNLELLLENNAFIQKAEVYAELNGTLHLDVVARKPVVRVFNDLGISVYIDSEGSIMPLSSKFTARVPIANGNITLMLHQYIGKNIYELAELTDHPDAAVMADIYNVASNCSKNQFWSSQISQVFVNKRKEIELIPRVGDHHILIGNSNDLEKKLNKLKLFYAKGLDKTGWNEYKIINLKYANQVVCTKS